MSVLKQQRRMIRQQRNQNALATAQMHRTYVSAHIGKESAQPELYEFLPHPSEYLYFSTQRKLSHVDKAGAADVLTSLSRLDPDVEAAIEPYLQEIELILRA